MAKRSKAAVLREEARTRGRRFDSTTCQHFFPQEKRCTFTGARVLLLEEKGEVTVKVMVAVAAEVTAGTESFKYLKNNAANM